MSSNESHHAHQRQPGLLSRVTVGVASASARRPKAVIALWLLMVIGLFAIGMSTGTKSLSGSDTEVGETRTAERMLEDAGITEPIVESVLIRSESPAVTARVAKSLQRELAALPAVSKVAGPGRDGGQGNLGRGGRDALLVVTMKGDEEDADENIAPVLVAVDDTRADNPDTEVFIAGSASFSHAIDDVVSKDLRKAEMISLPVTLLILFLVFGALVAASVPLLLGVTSVIAAMGLMGPISQFAPMDDAASSLVVLIGLAVGVDYSLFYIRREREERLAGNPTQAALRATAASVGRAIVVSGLVVMVAIGGLLVTGMSLFISMALATIAVIAIAVVGSLTVLPAVLAKLGDRIDRGSIPGLRKLRARQARTGGETGFWGRVAGAVTRRPAIALLITAAVLGTAAVPALDMKTSDAGMSLSDSQAIVVASRTIESAFPGAPSSSDLVFSGPNLDAGSLRQAGLSARDITGGAGPVEVTVAKGGDVALVSVPMADRGIDGNRRTVELLRSSAERLAAGTGIGTGTEMLVTGGAASTIDHTDRLKASMPMVIAAVLLLALLLLLASFRSWPLALSMIGLNLMSMAATYGLMTLIFQRTWAEDLLGFTSTGALVDWVPIFAFVILFGLSMDYSILVLERVREARAAGAVPREAARRGVAATAGTITGAAVVMVAIFLIFPTLPMLEMKMLGIALAIGVLLDATLVRGVALPATLALLGERGMKAPRQARRRPPVRAVADTPGIAKMGALDER